MIKFENKFKTDKTLKTSSTSLLSKELTNNNNIIIRVSYIINIICLKMKTAMSIFMSTIYAECLLLTG